MAATPRAKSITAKSLIWSEATRSWIGVEPQPGFELQRLRIEIDDPGDGVRRFVLLDPEEAKRLHDEIRTWLFWRARELHVPRKLPVYCREPQACISDCGCNCRNRYEGINDASH